MDHTHTPGHGRPHINGVLLPPTCEVCGGAGTAFQASTTPGPATTFTTLPYLRCPECRCLYQYNRSEGRWDAVILDLPPEIAFVPLTDLPTYIAQWD
jgi:hypothetical protein